MDEYEEAQIDDVKTLKIWLAIVLGSLAFSGAVMFWNPGVTGLVAFDTGPNVDFNPDLISAQDYTSHLSGSLVFVIMLIILQIGIYLAVGKFYDKVEDNT